MSREKRPREARLARHRRLRQRVIGITERPRLCVFRSVRHIYAQVIDDVRGHTLAAASSLDSQVLQHKGKRTKTDVSKSVGDLVANRAQEKGTKKVVFDRSGYKFHGRVKALAQAAREGGLEF